MAVVVVLCVDARAVISFCCCVCSDCFFLLFFSSSSSKRLVLTSLFSSLSNHSRRSNHHTRFSSNRLVSQVTHMGFLADTIIWDFNLAAERASGTTSEGKSGEIILCRLSQHKVKVRFFFSFNITIIHGRLKKIFLHIKKFLTLLRIIEYFHYFHYFFFPIYQGARFIFFTERKIYCYFGRTR